MEIKKIMCCCGVGLGSSMLVRLNVEKVLKSWGIDNVQVEHSTVSDAFEGAADLFVVGSDLGNFTSNLKHVVLLDNIISIPELEEKLKPYFNK